MIHEHPMSEMIAKGLNATGASEAEQKEQREALEGVAGLVLLRAMMDVVDERLRQIGKEGWTPEHDDKHAPGDLAAAGSSYAAHAARTLDPDNAFRIGTGGKWVLGVLWPDWEPAWWKPTTPRRDLVKAAALILAEIERIDRAEARKKGGAA